MAGMGGLSGLAFVNQGYNKGAQDYWNTQNLETDNAATQALGRGLQSLIQSPMPGARPIGGPPSPGVPVPPQMQPGVGGPPQAGAPQPPMAGPAVAGGGGPQFQGSPLWQMLAGGPRPEAPVPMQGGGGAAPPQGPPMSPQGQPPQGGSPGGSPFTQPMTWQDVARAVVQANPGAPPQVIAAAVTKAMPLMQADSQQQWHVIQAELARARNETALRGQDLRKEGHDEALAEKTREAKVREDRLQAGLDLKKDTVAQNLRNRAEQLRLQSMSLGVKLDAAKRKEIMDKYKLYDQHMRTKIMGDQSYSGEEKKKFERELDGQYRDFERSIDAFEAAASDTTAPDAGQPPRGVPKGGTPKGGMTGDMPLPSPPPAAGAPASGQFKGAPPGYPGAELRKDGKVVATWDDGAWVPVQ